jgi:RNA recognition motif-containing protein
MSLVDAFSKTIEPPSVYVPVVRNVKRPRQEDDEGEKESTSATKKLSRKESAKSKEEKQDSLERLQRTIFVGNVPLGLSRKAIGKSFQAGINILKADESKLEKAKSEFSLVLEASKTVKALPKSEDGDSSGEENIDELTDGKKPSTSKTINGVADAVTKVIASVDIESVRFRSAPVQGVPITPGGSFKEMRKAATLQASFDPKLKGSLNAYVVFKTPEAAKLALRLNNVCVKDHYLRIDKVSTKGGQDEKDGIAYDYKRSVFVGNLPFDVSEDELRAFFVSGGLMGGPLAIEAIRIVRDRRTNVGKGIAFVLFNERIRVAEALGMSGQQLRKRPVRISKCSAQGEKADKKKADNGKKPSWMGNVGKAKTKGKGKRVHGNKKQFKKREGGTKKAAQ